MSDIDSQNESVDAARVRGQFSWKIIPLLAVTALVVYLLLTSLADADELLAALRQANAGQLGLAIFAVVAVFVVVSIRFRIVLGALGAEVSTWRSFDAIFSTFPFAIATPSRASDLLRAVALRDKIRFLECSSGVIAERLIDIHSICVLGVIGAIITGTWSWGAIPAGVMVAEWICVFLVIRYTDFFVSLPVVNRVEAKLRRLLVAIHALMKAPGKLLAVNLASLTAWFLVVTAVYFLTQGFGADISFTYVLALWPIAIFVGLLPLTVGGVGTRDAAFAFMLSSVFADLHEAPVLVATLGYSVIGLVLPGLVGLPFMLRHMKRL